MVAIRFEIAFLRFSSSRLRIVECVKSDMCKEKLQGKREVYRRSDDRQELPSCIRSGISQAANGVYSAVMLHGFAVVSSERAELHCSEPSCVDLFFLYCFPL